MGFAGHDPRLTPEERHIERLEKELRRKQDQCAALVAALEKFGVHPDNCGSWLHEARGSILTERPCTCGLAAAIAKKVRS